MRNATRYALVAVLIAADAVVVFLPGCASLKSPAQALAEAETKLREARETCAAVFAAAKAAPDAARQVPQAERDKIVKACAELGVKP